MQRVETYSLNEVLTSAQVNQIQDDAMGISMAPYLMVGAPYMYCDTSPTIKIGGISGLVLPGFPNTNLNSSDAEIEFDATTGGALATNTWYYVYATESASTITIAKTTTAPQNSLTRIADNQRYLGCFRTDGANAVYRFRSDRGQYLWNFSGEAANDFRVLNDGNATSFTDVDLSAFVPPHARQAYIKVVFVPRFNESDSGAVRTNGLTGGQHDFALYGSSTDGGSPARSIEGNEREIWILTDSSRLIEYKVSHADSILDIHVLGFREGL